MAPWNRDSQNFKSEDERRREREQQARDRNAEASREYLADIADGFDGDE